MKVSEGGGNVDTEVVPSQAVFLAGPHATPFLTDFSEIYVDIRNNIAGRE